MSTDASPGSLWPAGVDRVVLDTVDNTMEEAARRAPALTAPTWILAHDQTAARGRRGRPWRHPKGNFAATLAMRTQLPPDQVALTSFQAALALFDALAAFVRPERLSLKWPNDVLLDGGKVAGILLESRGTKGAIDTLLVGIGVNLVHAPQASEVEQGAVPPVALGLHPPLAAEVFLTELAAQFDRHGRAWQETGFETLRRLWLSRAARLGAVITARLPGEDITGTFDTVDEAGYLVLQTPQGARRIAAAEVYF